MIDIGWTITETIGHGIFNRRVLLTNVKRFYLEMLKWRGTIAEVKREGNSITVEISNDSRSASIYYRFGPTE